MRPGTIKVEIVENTGGGEKRLRQMTKISRSRFEKGGESGTSSEVSSSGPVYMEWKSVLEQEKLTVSLLCDIAVAREISRRSRLITQNSQPEQKRFAKDPSPEATLSAALEELSLIHI